VGANRVCPVIHKIRVRPDTRSVVNIAGINIKLIFVLFSHNDCSMVCVSQFHTKVDFISLYNIPFIFKCFCIVVRSRYNNMVLHVLCIAQLYITAY